MFHVDGFPEDLQYKLDSLVANLNGNERFVLSNVLYAIVNLQKSKLKFNIQNDKQYIVKEMLHSKSQIEKSLNLLESYNIISINNNSISFYNESQQLDYVTEEKPSPTVLESPTIVEDLLNDMNEFADKIENFNIDFNKRIEQVTQSIELRPKLLVDKARINLLEEENKKLKDYNKDHLNKLLEAQKELKLLKASSNNVVVIKDIDSELLFESIKKQLEDYIKAPNWRKNLFYNDKFINSILNTIEQHITPKDKE